MSDLFGNRSETTLLVFPRGGSHVLAKLEVKKLFHGKQHTICLVFEGNSLKFHE